MNMVVSRSSPFLVPKDIMFFKKHGRYYHRRERFCRIVSSLRQQFIKSLGMENVLVSRQKDGAFIQAKIFLAHSFIFNIELKRFLREGGV